MQARDVDPEESREWVRKRRAFARTYGSSAPFQFIQIVARLYLVALRVGALVLLAYLALRPILAPLPGRFRIGDYLAGLAVGLVFAAGTTALWWRQHRVTRAVSALASALGGTWGKDRFIPVLDWLDAHWPDSGPAKVLDLPSFLEDRWDVQTSHKGHPVLVMVRRRWHAKNLPAFRRVSFYFSAQRGFLPPGYDPAPAEKELEALGFHMRRMPAGVYAYHFGITPEMLDPGRLTRAFDAAQRLATGQR